MISVVITCYNLENYIEDAIQSVLDQNFDGDIEIIVVDDCSTDLSAEKIRRFANVRYATTDRNSGVMLATIAGVELASADIICFLDGDDIWEPDKLASVVAEFDDPTVGFVTHDLHYIDATGNILERRSEPERILSVAAKAEQPELLRHGLLHLDNFIWLGSAYCIRKSTVGWHEFMLWATSLPDPRNIYQDWPLAFWIASTEHVSMRYVDRKLFRYRLHGANHSGDNSTSERAKRNYLRAKNTVSAMLHLAVERDAPPSAIKRIQSRLNLYLANLLALERDGKLTAIKHFLHGTHDAHARGTLLVETAKFASLLLLGPDRFARTKRLLGR